MAMVMSLLRRGVPIEVAGLAADAVHPFAELGDWSPNRKSKQEIKRVSSNLAVAIGKFHDVVPAEDLKDWTRSAFLEYARIAGTSSAAGVVFAEAAQRHELAPAASGA